MDLGGILWTVIDLALHFVWVVLAVGLVLGVEYGRYQLRKRRWMAEHGALVGTHAVVVSNDDGRSVLDNGLELPAGGSRGAWRYRHPEGVTVEILGFPSFQNPLADPPVTMEVMRS